MTSPATVFLVDQNAGALATLWTWITTKGMPAETYASGDDFLASYDPNRPGCVVTEQRLGTMSGIQLQQQLTHRGSTLPVIVVTASPEVATVVRAMQNGAMTVLSKPFHSRDLWSNIQQAIRSDATWREQAARRQLLACRLKELNTQEVQVLDAIIAGQSNKSMALDMNLSLRTIEQRRRQVFKKMRAQSIAELVEMVLVARGIANGPPGNR